MIEITHRSLVRKARAYLAQRHNCNVCAAELVTSRYEIPDAIGFHSSGHSVLIECKTSRQDFLADREKHFRREPRLGMGDKRYFMAPKGLLVGDDVGQWGLIEVSEAGGRHLQARVMKESEEFEANKRNEVGYLTSIIRRLEISTAVFVQQQDNNVESLSCLTEVMRTDQ